jgi:ATP-dependent Clp protease ATP-binding subunit ClpX
MQVPKRQVAATIPPRLRWSYLAIYAISRSNLSTSASRCSSSQFNRSDFGTQPYTGFYDPDQPTGGPLGACSSVGAPRITPKMLKDHLDQFVVGQERAKKVLSTAVYNHYQRIQELERQDEEFEFKAQQKMRGMSTRHPVEGDFVFTADSGEVLTLESDEYPGQQQTVLYAPPNGPKPPPSAPPPPIQDNTPLTIEKSNVLLLGPSGVGKTLMAKTLARVLEVPFSMSDCTPLTQAGYIGEDVEVIISRLLATANYDVTRAEHGIICLDEIDKIATAKVSHGKDVSGEGVQQALLKIIEGTTVQVQAKPERSAPGRQPGSMGSANWPPNSTNGPIGGGNQQQSPNGKSEVFNVRTDNILFICTGAFIGLQKTILDRISKGSIGFGAPIRASSSESSSSHDTTLKGDDALFRKHLPFFTPATPDNSAILNYNTLDLVEPADLQKYGMIPELVGRIPISCALSSLDEEALVRVLTEPRNALLRQYEQLFLLSGIELRFTSAAMREIAKSATGMGTGARGLKTVLERLLGDAMFEAPGSPTKHILVTEAVAQRKQGAIYLARGQQGTFHSLIAEEEEEWERKKREKEGPQDENQIGDGKDVHNFQEYRQKIMGAGQ